MSENKSTIEMQISDLQGRIESDFNYYLEKECQGTKPDDYKGSFDDNNQTSKNFNKKIKRRYTTSGHLSIVQADESNSIQAGPENLIFLIKQEYKDYYAHYKSIFDDLFEEIRNNYNHHKEKKCHLDVYNLFLYNLNHELVLSQDKNTRDSTAVKLIKKRKKIIDIMPISKTFKQYRNSIQSVISLDEKQIYIAIAENVSGSQKEAKIIKYTKFYQKFISNPSTLAGTGSTAISIVNLKYTAQIANNTTAAGLQAVGLIGNILNGITLLGNLASRILWIVGRSSSFEHAKNQAYWFDRYLDESFDEGSFIDLHGNEIKIEDGYFKTKRHYYQYLIDSLNKEIEVYNKNKPISEKFPLVDKLGRQPKFDESHPSYHLGYMDKIITVGLTFALAGTALTYIPAMAAGAALAFVPPIFILTASVFLISFLGAMFTGRVLNSPWFLNQKKIRDNPEEYSQENPGLKAKNSNLGRLWLWYENKLKDDGKPKTTLQKIGKSAFIFGSSILIGIGVLTVYPALKIYDGIKFLFKKIFSNKTSPHKTQNSQPGQDLTNSISQKSEHIHKDESIKDNIQKNRNNFLQPNYFENEKNLEKRRYLLQKKTDALDNQFISNVTTSSIFTGLGFILGGLGVVGKGLGIAGLAAAANPIGLIVLAAAALVYSVVAGFKFWLKYKCRKKKNDVEMQIEMEKSKKVEKDSIADLKKSNSNTLDKEDKKIQGDDSKNKTHEGNQQKTENLKHSDNNNVNEKIDIKSQFSRKNESIDYNDGLPPVPNLVDISEIELHSNEEDEKYDNDSQNDESLTLTSPNERKGKKEISNQSSDNDTKTEEACESDIPSTIINIDKKLT